ncbi:MAG: prepilin-type N-terminal cleavage/methylation domain-containing protein [Gammaproteobacteria bacterium]|nr:prepilin-type N-terminal cleavage/methylation domain-containing protein [Gammaproteobacteria bacterium]MBQ0838745.1 prepilin-type N-terminal cleavage/methylation domain-containing protein [Gammaproteobacteria bacterium]
MSRGKALHSRGFTLVELQIAIVIMAMISLLLLGALRLTSQTWSKVTARQDAAEHQFLLSQLLRRHLSGARFFKIRLSSGEAVDSFIGGRDYLHYVAPFPHFINDGELFWWTLKIAWDEHYQQEVLVLDYQPFNSSMSLSWDGGSSIALDNQQSQRLVLEPNVEHLELAYYGDASDAGEEWHEEWPDGDLFPSAVPSLLRVNVARVESTVYQAWPEIVLGLSYASDAPGVDAGALQEREF